MLLFLWVSLRVRNMKIIVGIPVYDGKLQVETVTKLLDEKIKALNLGDDLQVRFISNCSHAAMGRNQLAQDFMDSDAERLIFLDSDVTFNPGDLIKIAHSPLDFVGGCYRYKTELEQYPIGWLPQPQLMMNRIGLIEVLSLPGGFLSLSRKVFEDLRAAHPERAYSHFGKSMHCWFQMLFTEGHLYGEDSYFCKEWRDLGGQVWLDPELELTHWDFNRPFKGRIGDWIKSQQKEAV